MSDDQYFADCLGCGIQWDGNTLSPVVDGDQITIGPDGLQADDDIPAAAIGLINGSPANYPYDPGCNGLKFDCETGALWYPTPPCMLRQFNNSGFLPDTTENGVKSVNKTGTLNLVEPIEESECVEGMIGVAYGWTDIQATFETTDYLNVNPRMEGYQLIVGLEFFSGPNVVHTSITEQADDRNSVNMLRTCIDHYIPWTMCFDPLEGLSQTRTITARSNYDTSTTTPFMDFEQNFLNTMTAMLIKEC